MAVRHETESEMLIRVGYGNGTNPVCSDKRPYMTLTGCVDCGHTLGEHARANRVVAAVRRRIRRLVP